MDPAVRIGTAGSTWFLGEVWGGIGGGKTAASEFRCGKRRRSFSRARQVRRREQGCEIEPRIKSSREEHQRGQGKTRRRKDVAAGSAMIENLPRHLLPHLSFAVRNSVRMQGVGYGDYAVSRFTEY